ncbi:MAG TPA: hypothetical protein VNW29_04360 [Candidatus Sulfotelmatobacter sp.]|nr:hypothetical protein [Candidatus Sulfotelmatobacter sp.]
MKIIIGTLGFSIFTYFVYKFGYFTGCKDSWLEAQRFLSLSNEDLKKELDKIKKARDKAGP